VWLVSPLPSRHTLIPRSTYLRFSSPGGRSPPGVPFQRRGRGCAHSFFFPVFLLLTCTAFRPDPPPHICPFRLSFRPLKVFLVLFPSQAFPFVSRTYGAFSCLFRAPLMCQNLTTAPCNSCKLPLSPSPSTFSELQSNLSQLAPLC